MCWNTSLSIFDPDDAERCDIHIYRISNRPYKKNETETNWKEEHIKCQWILLTHKKTLFCYSWLILSFFSSPFLWTRVYVHTLICTKIKWLLAGANAQMNDFNDNSIPHIHMRAHTANELAMRFCSFRGWCWQRHCKHWCCGGCCYRHWWLCVCVWATSLKYRYSMSLTHFNDFNSKREEEKRESESTKIYTREKKKIRTEYGNVKGMPILRKKYFFNENNNQTMKKKKEKKAQYRFCSWEKVQSEKEIQKANGSKHTRTNWTMRSICTFQILISIQFTCERMIDTMLMATMHSSTVQ